MLETEILQKMRGASIEERIAIIELLLQSLKNGLRQNSESQPTNNKHSQRAAFGFMKGTGSIHGNIIAPVAPESDWEVLQ